MDFSKGKIYKLINDSTDKIYIGSTCSSLNERLNKHKNNYKCFIEKKGKQSYITSYKLLELGNVDIILIEDYPCENKKELNKRERYYIDINREIALNKVIPTRTQKEYLETNKDKIKEYQKNYMLNYYQLNKNQMQEKSIIYRNKTKDEKKEYDKCYRELNKEKIKEKQKERYQKKNGDN